MLINCTSILSVSKNNLSQQILKDSRKNILPIQSKLSISNFSSFYTTEKNKFYARVYYSEGVYNFVIYIVGDIHKDNSLINSSSYTVAPIIHPFTVVSRMSVSNIQIKKQGLTELLLSSKHKANNYKKQNIEYLIFILDQIKLKKLNNLTQLHLLDTNWKYAEKQRKTHFSQY
jgi:hypothetical protein